MVQPIDQKTLNAIGGQKTLQAASTFTQAMNQTAQVMGQLRGQEDELERAERKFVSQQKTNKREGEAAELDMHIKRTRDTTRMGPYYLSSTTS